MCGWVAAFTSTCTGEVLARWLSKIITIILNSDNYNARCLEAPAVASLQQLQAESLRNSTGLVAECGEEAQVRAVARLAANLGRGHSRQVPVSALLRL